MALAPLLGFDPELQFDDGHFHTMEDQWDLKADKTDETAKLQAIEDAAGNAAALFGGATVVWDPVTLVDPDRGYGIDTSIRLKKRSGVNWIMYGKASPIVRHSGEYDKTKPAQRLVTTDTPVSDFDIDGMFLDGRLEDFVLQATESVGTQAIGGNTYLVGSVNITGATIPVIDNSADAANGQIVIDGYRISYSGNTGTAYTGCVPLQTIPAADQVQPNHTRVLFTKDFEVTSTDGWVSEDGQFLVADNSDSTEANIGHFDTKSATFFRNCYFTGPPAVGRTVDPGTGVEEFLEDTFIVGFSFAPLINAYEGLKHENIRMRNCTWHQIPGAGMYVSSMHSGNFQAIRMEKCDRGGVGFMGGNRRIQFYDSEILANDDNFAFYSTHSYDGDEKSAYLHCHHNLFRSDTELDPLDQKASNNNIHFGGVEDCLVESNICMYPGRGIASNKSNFAMHHSPGYAAKRVTIRDNHFLFSNDYGFSLSDRGTIALLNGAHNLSAAEPFTLSGKGPADDPDNPLPFEDFPPDGEVIVLDTVGGTWDLLTYETNDGATLGGVRGGSGTSPDGSEIYIPMRDIRCEQNTINGSVDEAIRIGCATIDLVVNGNRSSQCGGSGVVFNTRVHANALVDNVKCTDHGLRAIYAQSGTYFTNLTIGKVKGKNCGTSVTVCDLIQLDATKNDGPNIMGPVEYVHDADLWPNKPRYALKITNGVNVLLGMMKVASVDFTTALLNATSTTWAAKQMAQHSRTTHAGRLANTPWPGHIVSETDTGLLYVGNGASWDIHNASGLLAKTADQNLNTNDGNPQNLTSLVFPVEANEMWFFEVFLLMLATSTVPDLKQQWSLPASATVKWDSRRPPVTVAASPVALSTTTLRSGSDNLNWVSAAEGVIFVAGTAGNAQLQASQDTADASTVTVQKGSCVKLRRLA